MFPKKSRKSGRGVAHTLDRVFSEFIRLRDVQHYGLGGGVVRCVTCARVFPWREMDCGHFMHRHHQATRWTEINCHAQCKFCNRFDGGRAFEHGQAINEQQGKGTAERLVILAQTTSKLTPEWFENRMAYYRGEVKRLKKEMGL